MGRVAIRATAATFPALVANWTIIKELKL